MIISAKNKIKINKITKTKMMLINNKKKNYSKNNTEIKSNYCYKYRKKQETINNLNLMILKSLISLNKIMKYNFVNAQQLLIKVLMLK